MGDFSSVSCEAERSQTGRVREESGERGRWGEERGRGRGDRCSSHGHTSPLLPLKLSSSLRDDNPISLYIVKRSDADLQG